MTTVYFVRHARVNYENHDDVSRELTEQGMADAGRVARFLIDKGVDAVYSSPYKRAVDTVRPLAEVRGLEIHLENDFRERKVSSIWIADFASFSKAQWDDFDYHLPDGESLRETQARNIAALHRLLSRRKEQTVVIGTHGTALSTVINYYDPRFGYADFEKIKHKMPWIVKFTFAGTTCAEIRSCEL